MISSKTRVLSAIACLAACGAASAAEKAGKATVGVSINATILTGFGISVGTSLGESFNVRTVANGYSISKDFDNADGNYTGKVKLFTAGVLTDWQPFDGVFRITVGLLDNGNKITADGRPKNGSTYAVGDCSFTSDPADPLKLNGRSNFKSLAPYAGFGWGGNMSAEPGFYGTFDLGVMFSGAANFKLAAAGHATNSDPVNHPECGPAGTSVDAATDPNVQREVTKAQDKLNDDAGKYKLWPALGFGIGWRF